MLKPLLNIFKNTSEKDKLLTSYIKSLTGRKPKNLSVYFLALRHSSLSKEKSELITHSNERLEFLGDSILGAVIAEYLFKKYPFKDEGFLTEIRSRIVNGETLGRLAKKIGLSKFIEFNSRSRGLASRSSMHGDAMEALLGAIYLDRGFDFCKKFILTRLIDNHYDINVVVSTDANYKSQFITLSQAKNKKGYFKISEEKSVKGYSEFTAIAILDEKEISIGKGSSKKRAEQDAARKAIEILNAHFSANNENFNVNKDINFNSTENNDLGSLSRNEISENVILTSNVDIETNLIENKTKEAILTNEIDLISQEKSFEAEIEDSDSEGSE